MKDIIKAMGLDDKSFPAKSVLRMIGQAKDRQQTPEAFAKTALTKGDYRLEKIAEAYAEYQKRLKANNAVDFDDIIYLTVEILENFRRRGNTTRGSSAMCSLMSTRIPTGSSTVWRPCWPVGMRTSAW